MRPALLLPLLLLLFVAALPSRAELTPEEQKLVGDWRYESEPGQPVAHCTFRENGTYTAELHKGDELIRRFEGLWRLDGEMIVYTYLRDSLEMISEGAVERDQLIRLTDDYYTIEAGDHVRRTYFRVKNSGP